MHYHVLEDQTKATHQWIHMDQDHSSLFFVFSGRVRLATANKLSPCSVYLSIAKWIMFLRSALVLHRPRICAGAPFVYSVSVSITIDKTDSTKLEVVNLSNSKSCTFRVSNYSNHIASLFSVLEALAAKKKRFFFLKAFENTENYNMKQSLKTTKTTPI